MTQEEKIRKIEEVLEIDSETLSIDTVLSAIDEWDSVGILSLIVMIEEDFDKSVKGTDLKACKNVGDIINLM